MSKSLLAEGVADFEERRWRLSFPGRWDGNQLAVELRDQVGKLEAAGLLDPRLLDDFEAELADLFEAEAERFLYPFRDAIGVTIAERVFGHVQYANRLDRQLATGAAAAAAELLIEAVMCSFASVAAFQVCRLRMRPEVVWPSSVVGGVAGVAGDGENGGGAIGDEAGGIDGDDQSGDA